MTETEMREQARIRLESLKDYKLERAVLKGRIQRLMYDMGPAGLPTASIFEGGGGGSAYPSLEQLKQLTRLREELDNWHVRAVNMELEILAEIHKLDNAKRRALLVSKYINGSTLGDIAVLWGYSTDNVKRIHRGALLEFYEKNLKV